MKKQWLRLLSLCLCLVLTFALPATGQAAALNALLAAGEETSEPVSSAVASVLETRIHDDANLLTPEEEIRIAERILLFQQKTGMDFVVLTSAEAHEGQSTQQVTEDFYDYGGYGLDEENSGIAYFIDMYEYYHHLTTTGKMIPCLTDQRLEAVIDAGGQWIGEGDYAEGILEVIDRIEGYYLTDFPAQPQSDASIPAAPIVHADFLTNLPIVAEILLFLTNTAYILISVLTQF